MSIFSLSIIGVLATAGIVSMTEALERGDVDEASRQGALAGPVVVEEGLGSASRLTQLASIASAPFVEARPELLPALATVAGGPDRRTAIPAALSARRIARELAMKELPDDIGDDDVAVWRARFDSIAFNRSHFIEVRVFALDTVAALGGVDVARALEDPDADFRTAAVALVPTPTPDAMLTLLAKAVREDADGDVVRNAALALCERKDKAVALLGAQGLARIKKLAPKSACLAK